MASLSQDSQGNTKARKRLPDDVREEYGRVYGRRFEEKFHAPATTKRQDAERPDQLTEDCKVSCRV